MDRVGRLLIKAQKAVQSKAERFYMGFVEFNPDTGKWIAKIPPFELEQWPKALRCVQI